MKVAAFLLMVVALASGIWWESGSIERQTKEAKKLIGKKVIIIKDTLEIINYSDPGFESRYYMLGDSTKVSPEFIKQKQKEGKIR